MNTFCDSNSIHGCRVWKRAAIIFHVLSNTVDRSFTYSYNRALLNQTLKGNKKEFELAWVFQRSPETYYNIKYTRPVLSKGYGSKAYD